MLCSHDIDGSLANALGVKVKEVLDLNSDGLLRVAVVGEFSSGKSTIINALLRTQLLGVDVTQGTTNVPTIIEYGEEPNAFVYFNDGTSTSYNNAKDAVYENNLPRFVCDYTVKGVSSLSVKEVRILYPSKFLKNGIALIDTPGIDSTVKQRNEITAKVMQEADAALIVIPFDQPLPESVKSFLDSKVFAHIPRCLFVVSGSGIEADYREVERKLYYIKKGLENFKADTGLILPALQLTLEEMKDDGNGLMRSRLSSGERGRNLAQFVATEFILTSYLIEQKPLVRFERINRYLSELYRDLDGYLVELDRKHEERQNELTNSPIIDIDELVYREKQGIISGFDDKVAAGRSQINNLIERSIREVIDSIKTELLTVTKHDVVRTVVKENVEDSDHKKSEVIRLAVQLESDLNNYIDERVLRFGGLLLRTYPMIQPKKMFFENFRPAEFDDDAIHDARYHVDRINSIVKAKTAKTNFFEAVISAIFPVPIDEYKRIYMDETEKEVLGLFTSFHSGVTKKVFDSEVESLRKRLENGLGDYYGAYRYDVKKLISDRDSDLLKLDELKRNIARDRDEIKQRLDQLQNIETILVYKN